MSIETVQNAVITSTSLGCEDHGCLSFFLHLDYGGSGQGFGGYALDMPPAKKAAGEPRRPHAAAGLVIARVLETLGVRKWEKLPGTHCRARGSHNGVRAIGHILEDKWFDIEADLARLQEATS